FGGTTFGGVLSASASGNTVNYDGIGLQGIKDPSSSTYWHLSASGSGTKTLQANTIVWGNLTISSTLDCAGLNINLAGNWNNTGSFTETGATVTFDGSGTQSITNTAGETFNDMTLVKSGGVLNLNNNVTVSNILTLNGGNIEPGTNVLTLGTGTGNVGTLTYFSGTILGKFERWFATITSPAPPVLFPVGVTSDYRPANVTFNTGLTAGSLIGEFIATDPDNSGLPLRDGLPVPDSVRFTFSEGYWDLTPANSLASTDYNLECTGNGYTSHNINSSTRLLTRTNAISSWTTSGAHLASTGNTAKRNNIGILPAQHCFGDTTNCTPATTPSPISGTDSVCINQTGVSYWVNDTGGYSYTWEITGGGISYGSGTDSITVTWGATGGAGNVRVTASNSCAPGSPIDFPVNIHTLPTSSITGNTSVAENTTEAYSVTNNTGYTYDWTITGGTQASGGTTNGITVNWGSAGSGNVRVIASNGCGSAPEQNLAVTKFGVVTSVQTGDWNVTSTWDCNCVPTSSDHVVIDSTDTVTLTATSTITNFTINATGTLDNAANTFNITGNYTNNGTHAGTGVTNLQGGSTNISGTGTITITGALNITIGNKTILSSTNLTKSTGVFSIAAGLIIANNGTMTLGGNITGGDAASTWSNNSNSSLNAGGTVLIVGTLNAQATGNTINYNGAGTQTVKAPTSSYYHFNASGGGTKTLAGNTDINGNLTISSTLDASATNYSINLAGTWSNTGTFTAQSGSVTFDGTATQTITNAAGEIFYNLTGSKSAGDIRLYDIITVTNNLSINSGTLDDNGNQITGNATGTLS
ncbi:hypothetical protein JYT51_02445, partial [Candidatus Amoebophilus asiaticus]|nr:hypothetical protein [Candidatus Amoebophilus asiaticus]